MPNLLLRHGVLERCGPAAEHRGGELFGVCVRALLAGATCIARGRTVETCDVDHGLECGLRRDELVEFRLGACASRGNGSA